MRLQNQIRHFGQCTQQWQLITYSKQIGDAYQNVVYGSNDNNKKRRKKNEIHVNMIINQFVNYSFKTV